MTKYELYTFYIAQKHYQYMECELMEEKIRQMTVFFEAQSDNIKLARLDAAREWLRKKKIDLINNNDFWAYYYAISAQHNSRYGGNKPSSLREVERYFEEKNIAAPIEVAFCFFQRMENLNWQTNSGKPIRNWKLIASKYIAGKEKRESFTLHKRELAAV